MWLFLLHFNMYWVQGNGSNKIGKILNLTRQAVLEMSNVLKFLIICFMCQVICWPHVKHITIHKKSNPIDGKLFKLFENLPNYLCIPVKCCGMVAWLSALIPGAIVFMQQIAHRDWFYPQVQAKMDQTKLGRNYAKFSGKIWSASGCAKMNQSGRI